MRIVWMLGLTLALIGGTAEAKRADDREPKPGKCERGASASLEGAMKAGCRGDSDDGQRPDVRPSPKPKPSPRPKPSAKPKTCEAAAVAAAEEALAAACPCAGKLDAEGAVVPWRNHGEYVSCVARAKGAARRTSGGVPARCLRGVGECAARSTCGKRAQAVTCSFPGATCVGGMCSDGRGNECGSDADCGDGLCTVGPSAEQCSALGGSPGKGSCCAPEPLGSPSGAFLDGALQL
jgi:hypothetical protein